MCYPNWFPPSALSIRDFQNWRPILDLKHQWPRHRVRNASLKLNRTADNPCFSRYLSLRQALKKLRSPNKACDMKAIMKSKRKR